MRLRISFVLRLVAILAVQIVIMWWLTRPGVLWDPIVIPRAIYPGVIPAAIVSDVSLCGLILMARRRHFTPVAVCAFTSTIAACAGCGLVPVPRGYGPGEFELWLIIGIATLGWLVGCISYRIFRAEKKSAIKEQQENKTEKTSEEGWKFSLAELMIAMFAMAMAAWVLSFLI
jgi:hypothetical protein